MFKLNLLGWPRYVHGVKDADFLPARLTSQINPEGACFLVSVTVAFLIVLVALSQKHLQETKPL